MLDFQWAKATDDVPSRHNAVYGIPEALKYKTRR